MKSLQKQKKLLITIIAVLFIGVLAFFGLKLMNKEYLVLNVQDGDEVFYEYGSLRSSMDIKALCKGTILNRKGTPVEYGIKGDVDYTVFGKYPAQIIVSYKDMRIEANVTIVVRDTLPPVIELYSDKNHFTNPAHSYEEEGYVARDNYDGMITDKVVREEKNGVVYYTVTDTSGNTTTVERVIVYKDLIAPVIQLNGGTNLEHKLGDKYVDPGYTAIDECDGDITSKVKVSGTVDAGTEGTYSITYSVADECGNKTSVIRNVIVKKKSDVGGVVNPGDKVIYLTFDDGPSQYTEKLLDILDAYGVKATFFVSAQSTKYRDFIGEAYDRGHTIGLHTYSHKYNEIYSSTEAYYEDLKQIRNLVYDQTGEEPWLIRFPGGTGNSISKRYCSGIMTAIAQGVSERGYLYCDWNVDSQDAVGNYTRSEIATNVIQHIKGKQVAYVLQHDIYEESVEAVEDIICWGLSNGYTFLPIEKDSPMIHQTIVN